MQAYAKRVILTAVVAATIGCGAEVGTPILAGQDAREPGLVAYLRDLHQEATLVPKSAELRGRLAMAYDANGFTQAAASSYAQAQQLDPKDFRWPYLRAAALAASADYETALVSIDRAIALDPNQAGPWIWRGSWLLDFDDHEGAHVAFVEATRLAVDPATRAAATIGQARTLLRQGAAGAAVDLLEDLANNYPHEYVNQVLRTAYLRDGRVDAADRIEVDEDAVQLEWSDEFQADKGTYVRGFSGQMLIAERMIEDGHAARALEILQSLQITAPQDRELMNNLSIALKVLGREQEAFDVLRKALEAHPDFHLFHFNIAVIHEQRGSADLALTHYDRAIELDPSLYAAYERKYGVLVDQQQYEQALVVLDEAARYGRTRPTTLLYAGLVAATLGKWDLAIEKLQQALVLDPNFARAQLFLGRSLAEAGQFEAAYEALESAAKMGANGHDVTAARIRLRDLQAGASAAVAPEVGSPEAIVPKIGAPE